MFLQEFIRTRGNFTPIVIVRMRNIRGNLCFLLLHFDSSLRENSGEFSQQFLIWVLDLDCFGTKVPRNDRVKGDDDLCEFISFAIIEFIGL